MSKLDIENSLVKRNGSFWRVSQLLLSMIVAQLAGNPKKARRSYLTRSGLPAVSSEKNVPESQIINLLLTELKLFFSVKMAGYWPRSFLASLRTSTPSRSINTRKKNLANILPS